MLTGKMHAHNGLGCAAEVTPGTIDSITAKFGGTGTEIGFEMPPCSAAIVRLK